MGGKNEEKLRCSDSPEAIEDVMFGSRRWCKWSSVSLKPKLCPTVFPDWTSLGAEQNGVSKARLTSCEAPATGNPFGRQSSWPLLYATLKINSRYIKDVTRKNPTELLEKILKLILFSWEGGYVRKTYILETKKEKKKDQSWLHEF